MPGPLDTLNNLLRPRPSTGSGQDIELPSGNGPSDPLTALRGAATIGASKVGERYAEPENPSLLDLMRQFAGGAARPSSVAAADPYGIEAWKQGSGPVPGLMMGSIGEPKGLGAVNPMFTAVGEESAFNAPRQMPRATEPVEAAYQRIMTNGSANRGVRPPIGGASQEPHPAIRALLDSLSQAPSPVNPDQLALGDRVTSFQVPHRQLIQAPPGFELPSGTSPFPDRPDALVDQYVTRRRGLMSPNTAANVQQYGTKPTNSKVPALPRAEIDKTPQGFESKFSLSDMGLNDAESKRLMFEGRRRK